ncbi:hypothetical protein JTE90_010852 [Oedothorax gibbosus]|uniref:Reverse transcriptase RNase H-like domain-containing protein n=1 Tax=Oedothorax gibbosus TaxID=931172 RepID=A0AAV6V2Z5_9ARAC|nr:hypothetical protein JTE90_010852 [Oedothorax gibbosus]
MDHSCGYNYVVKGHFKAHTADVRVVKAARVPDGGFITGSRDTLVKLWIPTETEYRDEHTFIGATKFIASLCALPVSTQYPDGLILAGSNDCAIYGFTPKSQYPVMKLLGHSNVVCTLSAGFGLFVSGSWDGTARVWSGQHCTAVLEGHNSTVWATEVYPLQNIILTGSADHTIRIWRDGQCEKVLYGHEDCVRGLIIVQNVDMDILSCSNDATVRLWNIQGECLNIFQSHENYIYDITLLRNGVDFATCSEDEHVKIWQNGVCVQSIKIPLNTLWNVTCLKNGDIVVGCSDGSVCILENMASEAVSAFQSLKDDIASASLTAIEDDIPFRVETDASDFAIGATLSQAGRPIAFFSCTLNKSEQRHSSIEKEAYAIVESLRYWRHYLIGRHFEVFTDQRSVAFMFNQQHQSKTKNEKILRWHLDLTCFKFDIIYRPLSSNAAADAFSRISASAIPQPDLKELHIALCHPGITRMYHWVRGKNLPFSLEDIKALIRIAPHAMN